MTATNYADTITSMKILVIFPFFHPHYGGTQRYIEEIYSSLLAVHKDISVDILCYNTDGAPELETYREFNVHRIPCWNILPGRFALPNPLHLVMKLISLAKNRYDFINTHERFFDSCWWAWFYAKSIGAKSIFTGHVPSHPAHQNKLVELTAKVVDLTLATWSLKNYDMFTFANGAAQAFAKRTLGLKKHSEVVYIGVDTKKFHPQQNSLTFLIPNTDIEINENQTLVAYLGRLIWTKGVDFFFDAAAEILEENPDPIFAIAGSGELENSLKEKVKRLGLEKHILFTGALNYDQAAALLGHSHVFVNPSHHNEGLPNTILEAGSSGCCVIATDIGATKELIENRKTGYLIKPKDKNSLKSSLLDALSDETKRKKFGNDLRKKVVENFNWEKSAEKLYSILSINSKSSS